MNDELIVKLLQPTIKSTEKKLWSIPVETILVPRLISLNAQGLTDIPKQDLGCIMVVNRDKNGDIKRNKDGELKIVVNKTLRACAKNMRDNFIAQQAAETSKYYLANPEAYNKELQACREAGKLIRDIDQKILDAEKTTQSE